MKLTLQIHDTETGWITAGELSFKSKGQVLIEYDIDYASTYFGRRDLFAFSLTYPVQLNRREGEIPGFLIDLIPQGNALKRLMARHGILSDTDYQRILTNAPLASPGNLRVFEPWQKIEKERPAYVHQGFTKDEVIAANLNFLEYMERHGAPVGGTSGAAGGAPKFLLREDFHGKFHADGYLDDSLTKAAWLIKFPFTDSENSKLLTRTEKAYYDVLRELPVYTGNAIEIERDILFIPRFDRVRRDDNKLHYLGLESFYSAHDINTHGFALQHEDNIKLIAAFSTKMEFDICEYLKRDLINRALANTDNHGRNTSFIKDKNAIYLSPMYDVTAMRFFEGDLIVPLCHWRDEHKNLAERIKWISAEYKIQPEGLTRNLKHLRIRLTQLDALLVKHKVPPAIIERSSIDRKQVLDELKEI